MPPIVKSMFICEESVLMPSDKGSKLVLVSPIINFIVPFLPTQLSFSLFSAVSHFSSHEEKCEIQILDPDGELLHSQEWLIIDDANRPNNLPPSSMFSSNIKNLIVRNEGSYRLNLMYEGVKIGEYVFDIIMER